jgi:hypothetical protein
MKGKEFYLLTYFTSGVPNSLFFFGVLIGNERRRTI